jgi:hypothetical protein
MLHRFLAVLRSATLELLKNLLCHLALGILALLRIVFRAGSWEMPKSNG